MTWPRIWTSLAVGFVLFFSTGGFLTCFPVCVLYGTLYPHNLRGLYLSADEWLMDEQTITE
jgi:hypothetical protein